MKTANRTLSKQIRKQMDEREIAPSRDLWSEIQLQAGNGRSGKSGMNKVLLAACLVLLAGLGAILFFNRETAAGIQTAKMQPKPVATETPEIAVMRQPAAAHPVIIRENNAPLARKEVPARQKTQAESSVDDESIFPAVKETLPVTVDPAAGPVPVKIIAQADSVQIKKKKKYADPATLLFSVEHKEVIEKTKGGSNVATIDLHTK